MSSTKTLDSLKGAELLGANSVDYNLSSCDNICDGFCDDCPDGRAPTEITPYTRTKINEEYRN